MRNKKTKKFSKYFLLLFAAGILILPLQNNVLSTLFPISRLWNDFGWFSLSVLLIFYVLNGEQLFSLKRWEAVQLPLFLCSFILLFSIPFSSMQMPQTLLLITAALSVPFIYYLVNKHGASILILTILAVLILHAQWGIAHLAIQEDFGLQLLGESNISSSIDGVAKFQGPLEKFIRSYGPYPHPNIFATACLSGLLLLYILILRHKNVLAGNRVVLLSIYSVLVIALLSTFTRAAYLGLIILIAIIGVRALRDKHLLATLKLFIIVTVLLSIAYSPLFMFRMNDQEDKAIPERISGTEWAIEIIKDNPWRGIGVGNYVFYLDKYLAQHNIHHMTWEVSPVHSVPLLLTAELGVPATIVILVLTLVCILRTPLLLLLSPFVPLFLTDHNLYTSLSSVILVAIIATTLIYYQHSDLDSEPI